MLRHLYSGLVAITLLSSALTGCAATIHPARERFSKEYDCPLDHTTRKSLGGSAFRVSGCGMSATYVCQHQSGRVYPYYIPDGPEVCVKESAERKGEDVAMAPRTPQPRVQRYRDANGGISYETTLRLTTGSITLRAAATADVTSAVATVMTRPNPQRDCRFDVAVDGVRGEVPDPKYASDNRRFFVELPLDLLAAMARGQRVLTQVCAEQAILDASNQQTIAQFLTLLREATAFAKPAPTPQFTPAKDTTPPPPSSTL